MATIVVTTDVSTRAVGDKIDVNLQNPKARWVRIANASIFFITVNTNIGTSLSSMVPGEIDIFPLDGSTQYLSIAFTASLNTVNPPATELIFNVYSEQDKPLGNYPVLGPNLSGSGTVSVSQASSVKNDGSASGTVFVESTASGDPSSDVSITVDGAAQFANRVVVGKLGSGSAPFANNFTLAQNGAGIGSGCNILPDNPTGIAAGYALFVWNGASYVQVMTERSDGGVGIAQYITWANAGAFLKQCGKFTGSASGNYSTGCTTTVTVALITQSVAGSSTYGWDTPTGAGVIHVTSAGGAGFAALAFVT